MNPQPFPMLSNEDFEPIVMENPLWCVLPPSAPPAPPEKPKRNLSAYNLFFKKQRETILAAIPEPAGGKPRRSHGKIGFAKLARTIAAKWKTIEDNERAVFLDLAAKDKERYVQEMKAWKESQTQLMKASASDTPTITTSTTARSDEQQKAQDLSLVSLLGGTLPPLNSVFDATSNVHPVTPFSMRMDPALTSGLLYPALGQQQQQQQQQQPHQALVRPCMDAVLSSSLAFGDLQQQQQQHPQSASPTSDDCISDLADQLDVECQDLLLDTFGLP